MAISRIEKFLQALRDGKTPDIKPQSRVEAYMQALIENGGSGGVSSWNDLPDRPFGEMVLWCVDGEYEFAYEEGMGAGAQVIVEKFLFEVSEAVINGAPFHIEYDGKKYECPPTVIEGMWYFGNLSMAGMPDTGEPFMGVYSGEGFMLMDLTAAESMTKHVKIGVLGVGRLTYDYLPVDVKNNQVIFFDVDTDSLRGNGGYMLRPGADMFSKAPEDRLTSDEFLKYVNNGVQIGCKYGSDTHMLVTYGYLGTYWHGIVLNLVAGNISGMSVYTAEYTPESTASE